jgi:D-3-phosphoglycerate dehydrogenase / 2-oxoglutarate reductase
MYKILTLNNISVKGLDCFPRDHYEISSEMSRPDAILVRSHDMHDMRLPDELKAIGRAGAGVNNIPVQAMSERGVAVFNAPGANANAVKELVVAGMLLAARNLFGAWDYTRKLNVAAPDLEQQVEAGKKRFVGFELPGRTLGVVGLGAIGVQVANAARVLGMQVIGYDPKITVRRAWQLSSEVQYASTVDELLSRADFITFHVPLVDATRNMINADRLERLKPGAVLLNFARPGVVDDEAACRSLDQGRLHAYVSDFPNPLLMGHPKVFVLPHLGASTREAEENCAVIVAEELRDFLEHGNVRNSVNLPDVHLDRAGDSRLTVIKRNLPDMVGQMSHALGKSGLNIVHMVNESRGPITYSIVDVEGQITEDAVRELDAIDGVLRVRVL